MWLFLGFLAFGAFIYFYGKKIEKQKEEIGIQNKPEEDDSFGYGVDPGDVATYDD
ncbi:hypothetical protein GHNINEIG_01916 [Hydrogenovibrio crunogenus]|uniref:Uncharacterized protein n=1 Tax=Hydrogenovibrio crunogenus TaxID=39765 RepID=A0A4P7P1J9_9GAMM|nr:hypothetical protein [Hydrogenovibrio crunogenus]QBZ83849.1 hypothetical protein GHNINEIG_01916 [Hydrogenovibrio crunogenus]